MNTLEKMARAMDVASHRDDGSWDDYLPLARAALEAIREPSTEIESLIDRGASDLDHGVGSCADVWSAMIDAILRGEA